MKRTAIKKTPTLEDRALQIVGEYEVLAEECSDILKALAEKARPPGVPGPMMLTLWRNKALVSCPFHTLKAALGKL